MVWDPAEAAASLNASRGRRCSTMVSRVRVQTCCVAVGRQTAEESVRCIHGFVAEDNGRFRCCRGRTGTCCSVARSRLVIIIRSKLGRMRGRQCSAEQQGSRKGAGTEKHLAVRDGAFKLPLSQPPLSAESEVSEAAWRHGTHESCRMGARQVLQVQVAQPRQPPHHCSPCRGQRCPAGSCQQNRQLPQVLCHGCCQSAQPAQETCGRCDGPKAVKRHYFEPLVLCTQECSC